jgi:release factor glutamine methyltransferase
VSSGAPSPPAAGSAPGEAARVWTPKTLLAWTEGYLRAKGVATPRLDAELLLAHSLGLKRLDLYLQFDRPMAAPELTRFREQVRRRGERIPVAYLTGEAEFWSLTLEMAPGCLIPRPDTETLVDEVLAAIAELRGLPPQLPGGTPPPLADAADGTPPPLADAADGTPPPRAEAADGSAQPPAERPLLAPAPVPAPPALALTVLELGTGSGAIALAACSETEGLTWIALERSPEALAVARRNRTRHAALLAPRRNRLWLVRGDGFAALKSAAPGGPADLIVSNPPYIPSAAIGDLMPEVSRYEPRAALDGGPDGLAFYRLLLAEAAQRLRPGGRLVVELGHDQLQAVRGLAAAHPALAEAGIRRDLGGHARVLDLRKLG